MRAVVYDRYGPPDVLEVREVDKPNLGDDRLLIRVNAASLNRSDWEVLTARPVYVRLSGTGFLRPKKPILGSDIAGTVEAVGDEVTRFQPGDDVMGDIMWHGAQAFAEYVSVAEQAPLIVKPPGLSVEQAAAMPQAAVLALQGLRHIRPTEPGDRVLIIGAGGGGGTFAIQLARAAGAVVTAVDNGGKLAKMRELGADEVIDYTREDFARSSEEYDRILDFAGRRSIFSNRRVLRSDGVYAMVGGTMPRLLQAFLAGWVISKLGDQWMGVLLANPNREDLSYLANLAESGALTSAIEQTYPLEGVPEALQRLGQDRAVGKLVITM